MLKKLVGLFKPVLTEHEFAKQFGRELTRQGYEHSYDASRYEFRLSSGMVLYIGNFYREHQSMRGDREAQERHIAEKVRVMTQASVAVPGTWELARTSLLPSIRRRADELAMREGVLASENFDGDVLKHALFGRSFGASAWCGVCFDTPQTMHPVTNDIGSSWGQPFDHVWEQALSNLRELAADRWHQLAPGVFQSAWRDSYDTSRIFLIDMIRRLQIAGRPIAFLPQRDALIVVGDRDEKGILAASAYAADIFKEAPRPCTMEAFVLDDTDRWQSVPPQIPLHPVFLERGMEDYAGIQSTCTSVLQRWLERTGEEAFAAQFMVLRKEDGTYTSLAAWPKVPSYLPKAERVIIEDSDGPLDVAWDLVESRGLIPEPSPDWWPPRYYFAGVPSDEHIRALREATKNERGS